MDPEFLDIEAEHEHEQEVTSMSAIFTGDLNINKLHLWIGNLMREFGQDLFRYKGVLSVKGIQKKYIFQGVHMLFSGDYSDEVAQWKEDEERVCRFVFIGRNLDHKMLEQGLSLIHI